jgi:3D (Asp-Asp-Asp) domain-containing protein
MVRIIALLLLASSLNAEPSHHRATRYHVEATAFCLHGKTAAGTRSHTGTAAADPAFLPLGSVVRVHNAGAYSGEYLITDTGARMTGRRIDLRLASPREARRFGKRMVWVQVVKWGDGAVSGEADRRAAEH